MRVGLRPEMLLLGMLLLGSPGAGKSVFAAKMLVRYFHERKIPVFVWDPIGTIFQYCVGEVAAARTLLCDMAATHYTVPIPIYHRFGNESLLDVSQRFPETLKLSDQSILSAPIQGYNPLLEAASHVGILLFSMNLPLIVAPQLLKNPEAFRERLKEAEATYPEIRDSIDYVFKEYRSSDARMFRIKLLPFLDPSMKAICCAPTGFDWQAATERGYTTFFDFRDVTNEQKRSFLMLHTLKQFLTFVRTRKEQTPIVLLIEELKAVFLDTTSPHADTAIAKETIQLLDVFARNYNIYPILITQDLLSFGPQVQQSLLGMGTIIVGSTHNTDAATLLAKHLVAHSPGQTSTLEKDAYAAGQRLFKQLQPFHFMVRPAIKGGVSKRLYPITIENVIRWTDQDTIEKTRAELCEHSGQRTIDVLSEITSRLSPPIHPDRAGQRDALKKLGSPALPPKGSDDDVY